MCLSAEVVGGTGAAISAQWIELVRLPIERQQWSVGTVVATVLAHFTA